VGFDQGFVSLDLHMTLRPGTEPPFQREGGSCCTLATWSLGAILWFK